MKSSGLAGCFVLFLSLLVIPTAFAWTLTGSKEIELLQAKNAEMETQLAQQAAIISKNEETIRGLDNDKNQLQQQIAKLEEQLAERERQAAQCQEKLAVEAKRGSGIKVIFFGGDIIYEVTTDAFSDYRAGLRYRSIYDTAFAESLTAFESGRGGDMEILAILKEVDQSKDRLIDEAEAKAFRRNEETR